MCQEISLIHMESLPRIQLLVMCCALENKLARSLSLSLSLPFLPSLKPSRVGSGAAEVHRFSRRVPYLRASQVALEAKNPLPAQEMQETQVRSLVQEDLLEKNIAAHLRILAWKIPWTEEPGGLQSVGSQKSRTRLSN